MRILIVEDEPPAARRLAQMIKEILPEALLEGPIDGLEMFHAWLDSNDEPDLYLMDIQLSDGMSLEIFKLRTLAKPVIFTTAYDDYAIQAFKTNSIDYLLKPINRNELQTAIIKYQNLEANKIYPKHSEIMEKLLDSLVQKNYRNRFLVQQGERFLPIQSEQIAYFTYSEKYVVLVDQSNQSYIINETLEELEMQLDPKHFFRANRQFILSDLCIKEIKNSFNGKLNIYVNNPKQQEPIKVSREKANDFKNWLNG